ncbi:TM0106 family RecB-like putative nuclease [Microlunatus panaciterrae]|uniref:RecB family nuclease n=1 Tax=Microlunatus panaciterrae TaxID=400768 RepID=A0ABS2RLI6_9ACTN|nr:TM0106 family RecB-like putative nuclease [Microlunatus panaciterrae]MBM7799437.1 putative RecB family nuclease [Microlunatus panaciterrae]
MTVLLGAYAARSCAVKTHNTFDRSIQPVAGRPDDALAELFDGGEQFEQTVLAELLSTFGGTVADLRGLDQQPWPAQQEACLQALRAGTELVVGGALPPDRSGHRVGRVDLLIRGADQPDGTPGYHPAEVKFHLLHERRPQTTTPRPNSTISYTTFRRPAPAERQQLPGLGFRIGSREADLVQLAHYHRMLQAAGFATTEAIAAVIGTDLTLGQRLITWMDLAEPLVRTFSRRSTDGWTTRSVLERYDHEHAFRVKVAEVAQLRTGNADDPAPLVRPIRTKECDRCLWWEHCLPQLDPADVSLNINKSPLDVREISALRSRGITTITDLADADLGSLLPGYLPEVTHRSGAEDRLRKAHRRARLLSAGTDLVRETSGPIELPAADLEIDFDIETSADLRVYLWGFLVDDRRTPDPPTFHHFSRFADLDARAELELAVEALTWLRSLVEGPDTVRVFHYSAFEVNKIRELAQTSIDPLLDWARGYAEAEFVDLYDVVRQHFFGVNGLGLKQVASTGAGFRWRDDDPGGLNSQRWFLDAVHGETEEVRAQARLRVLEYNEDDVEATLAVRGWLRAPSDGWT